MAKKVKSEIKRAVNDAFPQYSLSRDDAPQGSNNFSSNVLIIDEKENVSLVKVIELDKLSADTLEQTFDSIQAAKEIKSPFLVPLLEAKKNERYVFLRFPFLKGQNLSELKASKVSFTEKELTEIAISLLRGIADFSRYGVVHQDLKPDNIFVTSIGEIKILDFGSSRFRKSSFKGSTRTNRSYSAPEQIYAAKPVNLELLRLTCDERSDVYSVGIVLYELCTGTLPFASNDEKLKEKTPPKIERTDISDDFKLVLYRLLSSHIRNRPLATEAVSFFETGKVSPLTLSRGGFYYSVSTSLARFQAAAALSPDLFKGIVARASRVPKSEIEYLSGGPFTTIIDPETYLFQVPVHINKKFKALPYYKYGLSKTGDPGISNVDDSNLEPFISDVFRHEISVGTDVLIPPYFLIKETHDISWTLDQRMAELALRVYAEDMLQLPLFKGVAVSDTILTTDAARGKVLDYLTSPEIRKYSGYYVVFENNSSEEVLTSGAWLKAVREFIIQLLATGKTVIWGHCSLAGIIFSSQPGLSIAIGEYQSQRNLYLPEQKQRGGNGSPHVYVPKMFARIKWPIEAKLRTSGQYPAMTCADKCCSGVNFTNPSKREEHDLATHFILQLARQFNEFCEGGIVKARSNIDGAQTIYNSLKNHPDLLVKKAVANEIKPSTTSFLDTWLDTFR